MIIHKRHIFAGHLDGKLPSLELKAELKGIQSQKQNEIKFIRDFATRFTLPMEAIKFLEKRDKELLKSINSQETKLESSKSTNFIQSNSSPDKTLGEKDENN